MRFRPHATTTAPAAEMFGRLEPRLLLTTLGLHPFPDVAPNILHEFPLDARAVAVIGVGDINADGRGDFAVTLAGADDIPREVRLYSGADASLIRTLTDDFAGFGAALAAPGDLTGDGVPDILVSSPGAHDGEEMPIEGGRGLVYLFSGADGALARTFAAPGDDAAGALPDEFGFAIAVIADLNSDGLPDILIGAPGEGDGDRGEVYLFSGADGALLRTFTGEDPGDRFGHAVADARDFALPDHPADGVHDILIGAPLHDPSGLEDAGKAYLFSGASGDLIFITVTPGDTGDFGGPPQAGARLGHAVGSNGTFLAIGVPLLDPNNETDRGRIIRVLRSGQQTATAGSQENSRFGERISVLGDITRRNRLEIAISEPGRSPETGGRFTVGNDIFPGAITADAGDIDGDGLADVIAILPGVDGAPDTVRIYSTFQFRPRGDASGASPDLAHIWFDSGEFILSGGEYTSYLDVPGLNQGDRISAINTRGDILGNFRIPNLGTDTRQPFVIIDGVRTELLGPFLQAIAEDRGDRLLVERGLGEDGSVLLQFNDAPSAAAPFRSWVYKDGEFTFLWNGQVHDINAAGAIVGSAASDANSSAPTFLRAPDGQVTTIEGFTAYAIADDGIIAGTDTSRRLALWQDGVITPLGRIPGESDRYSRIDIADGGRVLAEYFEFVRLRVPVSPGGVPGQPVPIYTTRIYYASPDVSFTQLDRLVAQTGQAGTTLSTDGRILTPDGVLAPIDRIKLFRPAPDSQIVSLTRPDGSVTAIATNQFGTLIAFNSTTDSWEGIDLKDNGEGELFRLAPGDTFTAFLDPLTGRITIARTSADGLLLLDADSGTLQQNLSSAESPDRITADLIHWVSTDGRVHLAGTDAEGEWISHYQTGVLVPVFINGVLIVDASLPDGNPEWRSSNLTTDHLAPAGLTLPTLTGVSVLVTPWNAFHIVGLDDSGEGGAGDVQTLWWAPASDGWRTDNITRAARDHAARFALPLTIPKLQGNLTAFVTPWSTIHIAGATTGIDATPEPKPVGHIGVLWWAPNFGSSWSATTLSQFAHEGFNGSPAFEPDSLTSLVTPWGGLAIAGITTADYEDIAAGDLAVFWWSPASASPDNPEGWNVTSLHDAATTPTSPTPPSIAGRLASTVTPTGHQHLFAISADTAAFLNFQWSPGDGPIWTATDLTAAV